MFTLGLGFRSSSGPRNAASLKNILASCAFDLDATRAASYAGAQALWSNLVAAPADGAARGDYDFCLGASAGLATDDPTFAGVAGVASASFAMDGGDYFRIPANTALLNGLHKTGATAWTLAIAFRYVPNGLGQNLFSTRISSTAPGVSGVTNASEALQLVIRGDTATAATSASLLPVLGAGDYVYIVAFNGVQVRQWLNSLAKVQSVFSQNASISDASGPFTVGGTAASASAARMANGSAVYAISGFNSYVDDAQAAQLFAAYEARHGRDYTP